MFQGRLGQGVSETDRWVQEEHKYIRDSEDTTRDENYAEDTRLAKVIYMDGNCFM